MNTAEAIASRLGCSLDRALELNDGLPLTCPTGKAARFGQQRRRASSRGVGWEISFEEWAELWAASGKWDQRGRGRDCYCMSRNNDVGPYRIGNVAIALYSKNSAEADKGRGKGRGYYITHKSKRRPYVAFMHHRYLGCYATPEEAQAAYRAATQ